MAERRMFAKTIVTSDAFLDMPMSARCLYFTLGLLADDDGFVNNPKSIMRQVGATDDDMNLLIAKKFVLIFQSGVIVIKHWRIHNYIQSDRYHPTKYQEEKDQLMFDDNGAYSLPVEISTMYTERIQDVSKVDTEVRLGKDSLGKDRINIYGQSNSKEIRNEFESLWKLYPKKQGKDKAYGYYERARKSGTTYEEVEQGINDYKAYISINQIDMQYVKQGSTFFSQKAWNDDWTIRNTPKASNDINAVFQRILEEHKDDI